jgi:hypothetical protein
MGKAHSDELRLPVRAYLRFLFAWSERQIALLLCWIVIFSVYLRLMG